MRQREVEIAAAFIRPAFDDLRHLWHKDDRVEMPDDIVGMAFYTVQQNFLAQALPVHAGWLKDETRFEAVFHFSALVICHQPSHRQRILCLVEIDDLPIYMRLKGCERR